MFRKGLPADAAGRTFSLRTESASGCATNPSLQQTPTPRTPGCIHPRPPKHAAASAAARRRASMSRTRFLAPGFSSSRLAPTAAAATTSLRATPTHSRAPSAALTTRSPSPPPAASVVARCVHIRVMVAHAIQAMRRDRPRILARKAHERSWTTDTKWEGSWTLEQDLCRALALVSQ